MVPTLCIIDTLIQKTGGYVSHLKLYQGSGWILQVPYTPGEYLTPGDMSGFRWILQVPYTRGIYHTWNYIRVQDGFSVYPIHQRDIHPCKVVVQGSY